VLNLKPQSAFARLRPIGTGGGVVAAERTGLDIATVMARKGKAVELTAAMKQNFGLVVTDGPRWISAQGMTVLGIGPGKWLAVREREGNGDFVAQLSKGLEGLASVVEQFGALGVLRLSGPMLYPTVEKGVQLDLAARAFPVGRVAVTSIAHVGITLWKIDEAPTIELAVARSLAGSFLHWLETSAAPHGLEAVSLQSR
jgi:heterotetrameric sarcosine oxidase gamma subunit